MAITTPLSDEFVRGHLGRQARLIGLSGSTELIRRLDALARQGKRDRSPTPVHQLICAAAGLDVENYLRCHTLLPFWRVTTKAPQEDDGFNTAASVRQLACTYLLRDGAYWCPRCSTEDVQTRGFSYWRRIHQLPGFDCCPDHGTALHVTARQNAFDLTPDTLVGESLPTTTPLVELSLGNEFVRRYQEISAHFLNRQTQLQTAAAAACLRMHMRAKGLRVSPQGKRPSLSDLILERMPVPWIRAHFPVLLDKVAGSLFLPIDDAWRGTGSNGQVYAMALSVLFDTTAEAIDEFFLPPATWSTRREEQSAGLASKRSEVTPELIDLYIESQGSHAVLSRALGRDLSVICRRLWRVGLPPLDQAPEQQRNALISRLARSSMEDIREWAQNNIVISEKLGKLEGRRAAWATQDVNDPKASHKEFLVTA